MSLAAVSLKWQYKVWNLLRTRLEKLRRSMADANLLCRFSLTIGVMAMAVVVIFLSTASRRPYAGTNNTSWHTVKASRMNLALRKVSGEAQALCRHSESEPQPGNQTNVNLSDFALNPQERFFLRDVDKFRSPPRPPLTISLRIGPVILPALQG
jgi:hypothetical protein